MITPRPTLRCVVATLVVSAVAACGGSDAASPDDSSVAASAETAPTVQSAVVETTTPGTVDPPADDTVPPVDTTAPVDTAPSTTAAPDVTTSDAPATTPPDAGTAEPVATETVPVGTLPVGYRRIFNDSNALEANVPAEWVELDGSPEGELERLAAAPDLTGFLEGYTQVGMLLVTGRAATPDSWMEGLATTLAVAEGDGCILATTTEYDDGVYTGTEHLLDCGEPSAATHLIGGRTEDGVKFFLLAIVRPADDPMVRDEIVVSFFFD